MTLMTDFQQCEGCPESGGPHIQINKTLRWEPFFQLQANDHLKFNGLVSEACRERFSSAKTLSRPASVDGGCWRRSETQVFCTGARREVRNIVVSLPVILAIEIGDESIGKEDQQHWDFPPTINPEAIPLADAGDKSGIIYDLVGYILINDELSHFTARYVCPNDMATIYTYDSMRHNGYPIIEKNATFNTHMTGRDIVLPDGFAIWEAFYHLRGGLSAQDKFYETRIKEYQYTYGLSFSEPNLKNPSHVSFQHGDYKEMPKDDQNWIARSTKCETMEYVSTQPPPRCVTSALIQSDGLESEEETIPLEKSLKPTRSDSDLINLAETSRSLSQISLPNSDFDVNCRCGVKGDGNIVYYQEDGEVVQCNDCKEWSHIACQKNGRASNLPKKKPFLCDSCDPEVIKQVLHGSSKKR
jgi:PHD finger protein